MTPSIEHRIDSLIQAMSDIVLPAIDADKGLAREQAQLIVAHLHLIKQQLPRAMAFDQLELTASTRLGWNLLELDADNPGLSETRQALIAALGESPQPAKLQDLTRRIDGAIEALVRAIRQHATRSSIDAMTAAVLAHTQEHSLRNRIWFASNGFDSERNALASADSLFAVIP